MQGASIATCFRPNGGLAPCKAVWRWCFGARYRLRVPAGHRQWAWEEEIPPSTFNQQV